MKILDIHTYVGPSLFGRSLSFEDLSNRLEEYPELEVGCVPAKPFCYFYSEAVAQLFEECGERCHPILRVDPWRRDEALEILEKYSAPLLFLHPLEELCFPNSAPFREVVEVASAKGMTIFLAAGYLPFGHPASLLELVQSFPSTPFLLTHGGQLNISGMHLQEGLRLFQKSENTFFETSGVYRQDYIELAWKTLGEDRLIFGSASPFFCFEYELERVFALECSERQKEKILYHNGRALLAG